MKVISPELLIDKFIKSATNGRVVSIKTGRILLVGISILLLAGLTVVSILTFDGIKAVPKYRKAKELLNLSKRLDHNSYEYHSIFGCYRFDEWNYKGDTQHIDPRLDSVLGQYGAIRNPYASVNVEKTIAQVSFDSNIWSELGIANPSSLDCGLERVAYAIKEVELLN